jgi:hypothetical protein
LIGLLRVREIVRGRRDCDFVSNVVKIGKKIEKLCGEVWKIVERKNIDCLVGKRGNEWLGLKKGMERN